MHQDTQRQFFSKEFNGQFLKESMFSSNSLAKENSEKLEDYEMPKDVKVPSGDDIREMKNWEFKYRTKNPKASDREVRRAVHAEFNIVVIGGQAMKKIR